MVGVAHRVTRPSVVRTGGLEAVGERRQGFGGGCGGCNVPPSIHAKKKGVDSLTGVISVTSLNSHTCNVDGPVSVRSRFDLDRRLKLG